MADSKKYGDLAATWERRAEVEPDRDVRASSLAVAKSYRDLATHLARLEQRAGEMSGDSSEPARQPDQA